MICRIANIKATVKRFLLNLKKAEVDLIYKKDMKYNLHKLNLVRLATATPSLRVADVDFNTKQIKETALLAKKSGSNIILFPELSVTGYTCGDLFFQDILIQSALDALTELKGFTNVHNLTLIVGAPLESNGKLFNTSIVVSNGQILGVIPKTYLCNNSEYYEERWFSSEYDRISDTINIDGEDIPFGAALLFQSKNSKDFRFGIEICEDLWALIPPSNSMAAAGATVIFNLSASNEYLGKLEYRKNIVKMQSGRCIAGYIYSSCGPGESSTDTVFSGHSMLASNGKILAETDRFSFDNNFVSYDIDLDEIQNDRLKNNSFGFSKIDKDYRIIEFNHFQDDADSLKIHIPKTPFIPEKNEERNNVCNEVISIQTTALMKRIKHIGIKNLVIGISGGLDSTLALLVSHKAFVRLGYDLKGIKSITMPGFGTTKRTNNNAEKLSKLLNTDFLEININDAVLQHFKDISHEPDNHNITYENSQARERTQILMDYANKVNGIVIGTGDMSELALGWATYNGDHMSMYGLNSGIPKTLIKYLIQWFADKSDMELREVLYDIIDTPVSPELIPADENDNIIQKTESEVGPYILNDFFLYYFLRHNYSPEKILTFAVQAFGDKYIKEELKEHLLHFIKRFFTQQFKRSAMPDGVKIGTVALSPRADWRMPSDASFELWFKNLKNIN
jgi:NAD+ synthase (glutamine-hydrolysing)